MNDSVFGQYSLFCVFGSVVGCVVVPLIAQVLQQQSMECMILSAIVLSLTAAHLNKRCSSVTPHSKIVITKEYEKKRVTHSISRKTRSSSNAAVNNIGSSNENRHEKEYMQQQVQQHQQHLEHLKIVEMEKRNELKRIKKLQKREERLKRKEEENRKKKELEEHQRTIKEKRLKQQKDKQYRHKYKTDNTTSYFNYDKFQEKDWTSTVAQTFPKTYENVHKQNYQKTEKTYKKSESFDSEIKNYNQLKKNVGNSFAIKNSNRTASCSSLSSIGSCDSSVSPSYTTKSSSWKPIWKSSASTINSWFKPNNDTVETLGCHSDRPIKSYSNSRNGLPHGNINLVSSSLFSVNTGDDHIKSEKLNQENPTTIGEYTLFGAHKLDGGSILTSAAF